MSSDVFLHTFYEKGDSRMQITLTARHMEITEAIRSRIQEKLEILDRVAPENCRADVILAVEKFRQKVEVTLHANGRLIHAESVTNDLYASMDLAVDKLERQLVRFKEKIRHGHNMNGQSAKGGGEQASSLSEKPLPELVKTKRFPVKPMSLDDAILQMELLDKDFFLYTDASSESLRVLYRRRDGSLGQIQPE